MSNAKDERDVYYIPPNFLTSGRLFGGMMRVRNAIEACVLVIISGFPIIHLPFSLTVRVIILCLITLPLGILGVVGIDGDSLSEFAVNWVKWMMKRRILYRSDVADEHFCSGSHLALCIRHHGTIHHQYQHMEGRWQRLSNLARPSIS